MGGRLLGSTVPAAIGLTLVGASSTLAAQEYHVDPSSPRSVVFESSTRLDTFRGRTGAVDGFVLLDGDGLRSVEGPLGELYLEVELASLDTGIELRNRHMRENYLEVDEHPYTTFSGRIDRIDEEEPGGYRVRATGAFSVHGVERTRTVECGVTRTDPGLGVSCRFPVILSDHDIAIPQLMFLRLAEEVSVEVEFHLRRVDAGSPLHPDPEAGR